MDGLPRRGSYETPENRAREAAVASAVAAHFGMRAEALKRFSPIDYALVDPVTGHVQCWLEIKCRNNGHDRFETYAIGLSKVAALRQWSYVSGKPAFLAIAFNDGIFLWDSSDFRNDISHIEIGGTVKRGDPADIEPMVHIPMTSFHRLPSGTA